MIINRAYKFRMYPNSKQKEMISKTLGCTRLTYNYYLNKKIENYRNNNKYLNVYDTIKDLKNLKEELPFLKEVDSIALTTTLFNQDNAFKKFFKEKTGYPKYKSKNKKQSYRTNYIKNTYKGKTYENIKLDLINKTITLPKLKEVEIRGYRNKRKIKGRIINATISKEAGKYYVSVCVEEEIKVEKITPTTIVGIDLGLKDLVVTSNHEKIGNPKIIKKYEKKIKGLNKWLSRCQKGSKNRKKVLKKLQTVYKKLRNARKYLLHSISKKLVQENDIITCETLKIKDMVQNKKLSKSILNASWNELIRQIKYKSKWEGKILYQIDTYYPSSQKCFKCDYKNEAVKDLKIRKWTCPKCQEENDRDINASENIMFEGIKKYMKEIEQMAK